MKRRPPSPDEEEPTSASTSDKPPVWPPAPRSREPEVALFIIPGPPQPGSSVIDVRSASRLRMGAFDPPLPDKTPHPTPPTETVAPQMSPVLEQGAPPADQAVDVLLLNSEPAPAPHGTPDLALSTGTASGGGEPFAERPLEEFLSESQEARALEAFRAESEDVALAAFPSESQQDAPSASPVKGRVSRSLEDWRRWSVAAREAWRETAANLWTSARGRAAAWRPVVAARVPRPRQMGVGALAATSVLLAFGLPRLLQVPPSEGPRRPSIAAADRVTPSSVDLPLSARPLVAVARLAPVIGNRAVALDPGAPDERVDGAAGNARRSPGLMATSAAVKPAPLDRRSSEQRTAQPSPTPDAGQRVATAAGAPRESSLALASEPPLIVQEELPDETVTASAARTVDEAPRTDSPAGSEPPRETPAATAPRADAIRADATRDEAPRVDRAAPVGDLASSDGIAEALKHLQLAYERRDATLAKAVWPTVNERALARAFDGLRSQSVTFDRCQLNVAGAAGEVECRGVTRYVPRVGGQYQRTESRQWKFRVQKGGEGWVITSAAAR